MEQSACSHQLRLLRNLGLVTGTRQGRSVVYALHDNHVAALLDQAVHHIEHLRLGVVDPPMGAGAGAGTEADADADFEADTEDDATPAAPEPSLP
jgi:hypothetical protein